MISLTLQNLSSHPRLKRLGNTFIMNWPHLLQVEVKKKKKRAGPTPIQRQLLETNDFMKYRPVISSIVQTIPRYKLEEFDACTSGSERVLLVYEAIPEESTTIDRLWPTELVNKDSRIRRELTAAGVYVLLIDSGCFVINTRNRCFKMADCSDWNNPGRDNFLCGDHDSALEGYNEAILYRLPLLPCPSSSSSGKGLAHTLARRAAFLLQTDEHLLALRYTASWPPPSLHLASRDLRAALEYGCVETELLDCLLDHHTQVPGHCPASILQPPIPPDAQRRCRHPGGQEVRHHPTNWSSFVSFEKFATSVR